MTPTTLEPVGLTAPTAEDIVALLAAHPEPLQYSTQRCALCSMHPDGTGQNHDPRCAWRLAKQYAAAAATGVYTADAPLKTAPFTVARPSLAQMQQLVEDYGSDNVSLGPDGSVSVTPAPKPVEEAPGSGTGRYGDGADHWTQTGDGSDYPGSYGIGPKGSVGQQLKPFVPYQEPAAEEAPVRDVPVEGEPAKTDAPTA